jgi:hypothetical protein
MVKLRQLLKTVLIAATLVASSAFAQTNLTQILDIITNPDGTPFSGTVVITWNGYSGSGSGTVSRLSTSARVYNGALSVLLVPTTTASPGTYYQVVYTSSDATVTWVETWQVPPSTTAMTLTQVRLTSTKGTGGGTGGGGGGGPYATLPIAISQVTGLASSLSSINNTLNTVQTNATALGNSLTTLNTTVTSLSASVNSHETSISNLSASVGTLTSSVNTQATTLTNLTNLVNGLNSTVNALSASSSNAVFVDSETPAGTIDGVNTAFSLANPPAPASSLILFRNGLALAPGVDYSLNGSAITFTGVNFPRGGDTLRASYRIPGSGASTLFTDNETPGGAINGTTLVFTLASAPNPANSLRLFRNGLLLSPAVDYTLSGSSITFTNVTTPRSGDSLAAYYRH